MSASARSQANIAQLQASDPMVSAFVAASAGTGKTKLLTDRLLRLMLGSADRPGADPARIQCLTFTKAAAAEMSLRLQKVLGNWVTLDDERLNAALRALEVPATALLRVRARALFAEVLDLPGGMRIGTIHAFCQSLLRRFPLEAGISPHFRLLDEVDAASGLAEAREAMLETADGEGLQDALSSLAGTVSLQQFGQLVEELRSDTARLAAVSALGPLRLEIALRRALGAAGDEATLLQQFVHIPAESDLRDTLRMIEKHGSSAIGGKSTRMLDWLSMSPHSRAAHWKSWECEFLKQDGTEFSPTTLVNDKLHKRHSNLRTSLLQEQSRLSSLRNQRLALDVARLSTRLVMLAAPVADAYRRGKNARAAVDYHDLIQMTSSLLVEPGAAWVLYKLDGGLDHLLLDEVQDTAPEQWAIARALTTEFFAGAGAREPGGLASRSIFAVGDRKQSIFSFQGADPDAFEHWQGVLLDRVAQADLPWRNVPLDVSFRSTSSVLALVDAVFAGGPAAAGVTPGSSPMRHIADREGHAGRVELWPLTPQPAKMDTPNWHLPERNVPRMSAARRLAETLAHWIDNELRQQTIVPSRGRPLAAGDVLVLVRKRDIFQRDLTRALKQRGVPVAGLDRMVLTKQPAVVDLLALCDTLLLPQDDLSLACVLTSPLGGLTDDSLTQLAAGRDGTLWQTLQARRDEEPSWQQAYTYVVTLLGRVDHVPPHVLLAEALGPLGGRQRLFARLGPDAAEPIDELLNAAQSYCAANPPALQGFLQWLRLAASEVKREPEGAGDRVRIMTVHGAKGLQAPLVILPDTTGLPKDDNSVTWIDDSQTGCALPVWTTRQALQCSVGLRLRDVARQKQMQEQNRLLYVALTRAEDRLIVCGWQPAHTLQTTCWYEHVRAGFDRLPTRTEPLAACLAAWPGDVVTFEEDQTAPLPQPLPAVEDTMHAELPAWAGRPPTWLPAPAPVEPRLPTPYAPSRPDTAVWGQGPPGRSPIEEQHRLSRAKSSLRLRRGQWIHTLLQHLPAVPVESWVTAIDRYLAASGPGLPQEELLRVRQDVLSVLHHHQLAPLFGPEGRAEAPLTGVVGNVVVGGVVDRLLITSTSVTIVDYKTSSRPPSHLADVPVAYLRQLSAYRHILAAIYPDRPVRCLLVWTENAWVLEIPPDLLDHHSPASLRAA